MKKRIHFIASGITALMLLSMVGVGVSHKVYGSLDTNTVSPNGEVMTVPANAPTPSKVVEHDSTIPDKYSNGFRSVGLILKPTTEKPALSEADILTKTDTLMKQFGGTSRNILLFSVSRRYGDNDFAPLLPDQATGDPHIQGNKFKDVPCYLVTINGVNIPTASDGPPGSHNDVKPASQLQAVVDATNGNILLIFTVHQVGNNHM